MKCSDCDSYDKNTWIIESNKDGKIYTISSYKGYDGAFVCHYINREGVE